MRYLLGIVVVLIFGISCKSPEYMSVLQVNKDDVNSLHKVYYALPATVIKITLIQEKKKVYTGEYSAFAAQYLGVPAENKTSSVSYQIKQIFIDEMAVLDSGRIFSLSYNDFLPLAISLNAKGFLSGINLSGDFVSDNCVEQNQAFCISKPKSAEKFSIPDFPKDFYSISGKEARAAFLASQIYTLRDDRHYLSIGEATSGVLPDGQALDVMLNYLQKLENKYLELFYGKQEIETDTFVFWHNPKDIAFQRDLLFRFSEQTGVTDVTNVNANPVYLDIETINLEQVARLEERTKVIRWKAELPDGLVYVIPAQSNVVLRNDNEILTKKTMQINQLGKLGVLPYSMLSPAYRVEFYPCKGTVKSITPIQ